VIDTIAFGVLCVFIDARSSLFINHTVPSLLFGKVLAVIASVDPISNHCLKWLSVSYPEDCCPSDISELLGGIIFNSLSYEAGTIQPHFARVLSAKSLIQKYLRSAENTVTLLESLIPLLPMLLTGDSDGGYSDVLKEACCGVLVELVLSCISQLKASNNSQDTIQINPDVLLSYARIIQEDDVCLSVKLCAYYVLTLCLGNLPCVEESASAAAEEGVEDSELPLNITPVWKVLFAFSENDAEDTLPSVHQLLSWLLLTEHMERLRRVGNKQGFGGVAQWVESLESFPLILSLCTRSYQEFTVLNRNRIPGKGLFNEFQSAEQRLFDWTSESTDTTYWVAGFTLYRLVCLLPSMTRKWWATSCPKNLSPVLQNFIETEVSHSLAKREVQTIERAEQSELFSVHGSSVSRVISAKYIQDECVLELVIRLPASSPLRNVEVDCRKRLGVSEPRWRRWVLQIVTLLSTQDGSVLDAVLLWKSNVDKEFEGMEPCPICYCILHPKSLAMPSLECHTCNNKFHPACLYKWFNSSHKSKCPLCQQPINI
jgi:hypothetical protein